MLSDIEIERNEEILANRSVEEKLKDDEREGFWIAWRSDLDKRRNQSPEEQRKEALYYESLNAKDYNEHEHREDLVILAALRASARLAFENNEKHLFDELTNMINVKLLKFKKNVELEEQSFELHEIILDRVGESK